jgi:hypothetical protein
VVVENPKHGKGEVKSWDRDFDDFDIGRRVKINKNPKVRNDTSDTSNEPALSRGTIKKMNRMRDTVGVS